MSYKLRINIIIALLVISVFAVFNLPPITQDPEYHNFADKRAWLGIMNFADVMSNMPYVIVGILGIAIVIREQYKTSKFKDRKEIIPFIVAFAGILMVGFGSSYYHFNPDNNTLVWDRLPMTIGFAAIFAIIIGERINLKAALYILPLLLITGIFTIYYWDFTENLNRGDLRPYALMQFFPIIAIPIIIMLFPAKYSGVFYLGEMVFWYIIAKILEHFDKQIFALTDYIISGHTLKHLASALATYGLVRYIKHRKLLQKI